LSCNIRVIRRKITHTQAAHARGELLLGGALSDPVDAAVLLFRGDSPAVAEAFAAADPYVTHGLITRWRVRAWATVVSDRAAVPLATSPEPRPRRPRLIRCSGLPKTTAVGPLSNRCQPHRAVPAS
jgi:uncharacterized protein YciI